MQYDWSPYIEGEFGHGHTGRMPYKEKGRNWGNASINKQRKVASKVLEVRVTQQILPQCPQKMLTLACDTRSLGILDSANKHSASLLLKPLGFVTLFHQPGNMSSLPCS